MSKNLPLSPQTVLQFFDYINIRYNSTAYQNFKKPSTERYSFESIKRIIKQKRNDLTTSGSSVENNDYKSLTAYQLKLLKLIVYPHTESKRNPLNPFEDDKISIRNYMIFQILELGLRRGELHLLTTKSFKPNKRKNGYYISVTNCEDKGVAKKKHDSSIKTLASHRSISIEENLYKELVFYVENIRNETSSDRLFDLSHRMINYIFEKFTTVIHKNFPDTLDVYSEEYIASIYPHKLRHTWAVSQLRYLVEVVGKSLDEAKDEIRPLGGWSIESDEPERYGRRYIELVANKNNLERMKAEKGLVSE